MMDAMPGAPLNVVFFSPGFPDYCTSFCCALAQFPVRALGIGDEPYDALPSRLKASLTRYYRVTSMENYDEVLRGVGFLTHEYGKIDRFESLNEYWLVTEARIRTDFNIPGIKCDTIDDVKRKSHMKRFFADAGVAAIRDYAGTSLDEALAFAHRVGYPVIVKPDSGAGAQHTQRVGDDAALTAVLTAWNGGEAPFIVEEYVDGDIVTYDGLVDAAGTIVFENSHRFDQSVMDVVNTDDHLHYVCLPDVRDDVRAAGRAIVVAFGLREKFFHIEMFDRRDGAGLVGLELNLRPPGAWMTDAINVAHGDDVYRRWAAMVAGVPQPAQHPGVCCVAYASRKDHIAYAHSHEDVLARLGGQLIYAHRIEAIFARAMGDFAYLFRASDYPSAMDMVAYIQQKA